MAGTNGVKRKRGRPAGWRGTYKSHKLPKPTVGVPFHPDPAMLLTPEEVARLTAAAAHPSHLVTQAKRGDALAAATAWVTWKCRLPFGEP